jgi:hypothetical protein
MAVSQDLYLEDIEGPSLKPYPIWDTPNPPVIHSSNVWSDYPNGDLSGLRMRYVPLRKIRGLTVCVTLGGIVAISSDEKLEHESELPSVHLRFPLRYDEAIYSMWIRSCSIAIGGGILVVSSCSKWLRFGQRI